MSMQARSAFYPFLAALVSWAATEAAAAAALPVNREDGKPAINGVWLVEKPQIEARTLAGKSPPLRAEAAALYVKRKQAKKSGAQSDDPLEQCLPHGVPRLLSAPRPIHILQKPKQISILYEANHQARLLYVGEPLPSPDDAPDPTFNGFSVAHWDGNALIVDTIGMNDSTWLDDVGLPHSEALQVRERYELADPTHLRVRITVTDPQTFTAPWDMQLTYKKRPDLRIKEDACAEKLWDPTDVAAD